jgi:hypothetical protein
VVEIPKPKGGTRPLGSATVEDRVVQTAMTLVLEPIFEADFHDCSYEYRPKRNARQASLAIQDDLYQRAWGVVELDFKSYFTSIPHRKLLKLSRRRIADGSMLKLIKQTLKVGVKAQGQVMPTTVGVPQGSPISPVYSNIYLNLLDQLWHSRGYPAKLGVTLHDHAYRFPIYDRDSIFSAQLDQHIRTLGLRVLKTPPQSPQATAICERLLGTLRRECLDFLIPLTEHHFRHLLQQWVQHYNAGRPHMSLGPGIPQPPLSLPVALRAHRHRIPEHLRVRAHSILGGLHHEYRLEERAA